jgi:hypothetical protein
LLIDCEEDRTLRRYAVVRAGDEPILVHSDRSARRCGSVLESGVGSRDRALLRVLRLSPTPKLHIEDLTCTSRLPVRP